MSFVKKILFIFLIFSCFSCSTVPNFSGNRKLCCLLIDENNQPVSNCVGFLRKNNLLVRKAYSNEKTIEVRHIHPIQSNSHSCLIEPFHSCFLLNRFLWV